MAGHPLPDADDQGCRRSCGSAWCLGPVRLGKTPMWSTSGGLHSAFLQGEWEYGALSCQLVLSSSCNVMAGRAKARQDLGCSHSAQVVRNVMLVAW